MILLLLSQFIALISLGECISKSAVEHQSTDSIQFAGLNAQPDLAEVNEFSNRSYGQYSSSPIVSTSCGKFEGASFSDGKNVQFDQFLGIRYAEPPVGKLRFKKPVPFGGYKRDQTYQATEFCQPCMQPKESALESSGQLPSEDCLCLNIYRPAGCDKGSNKPVLVYMYGGRFYGVSAAVPKVNGGYLGYYGDMIVVTMNYRLGPLGWLYSGNDEIAGNMGYYDTVLTVEWVKQYIGDFGGDPNAITIGGFGAGATLATKYLFDLKNPKDLFRAVMIASPLYNVKDYVDPPRVALRKSRDLARLVGCGDKGKGYSDELSKETINCLKNIDSRLLGEYSNKIETDDENGICGWNQLLPLWSPEEGSWDDRMDKGLFFKGKPIFIGGVPSESYWSFQGSVAETASQLEGAIERNIPRVITDKSPNNIKEIIKWYLRKVKPSDSFSYGEWATAALDDVCNACPQIDVIEQIKVFNPVYFYYYLYVTSFYRDSKLRKYGPFHGDDTEIIFGAPLREVKKYTDNDRAVSMEMISIYSDFVHGRKMKWPPRDAKSNPLAYIYGDAKANFYQEEPRLEICKRLDA